MTGAGYDLLGSLAELWDSSKTYVHRPVEWVQDITKAEMTVAQRAIMESVRDHRYTAVHACHDAGKSWTAAEVAAWWIESHPPGTATVVTTAPTQAQVALILWKEIARIHGRAELRGKIVTSPYPQWKTKVGEIEHVAGFGRKPADSSESNFQGVHDEFVLVIIDESCGVTKKLFGDVDTIVTNDKSRVLAVGNPDDPTSHFASICGSTAGNWNVLRIDGLQTPNMSAEKLVDFPLTKAWMDADGIEPSTEFVSPAVAAHLLHPRWIEEQIRSYTGLDPQQADSMSPADFAADVKRRCEAVPRLQSKVRGLFPAEAGAMKVIPFAWAEAAMERWKEWDFLGRPAQSGVYVVGVDVAAGGGDLACFAHRIGRVVEYIEYFDLSDTMLLALKVAERMSERAGPALSIVDANGVGLGVHDRLSERIRKGQLDGRVTKFRAAAQDKRKSKGGDYKFYNNRSASWWRMRELLDPVHGSQICLPPDDDLLRELCAPGYKVLNGNVVLVEKKEDIRKRLGRSTDAADAVIMAYWNDALGKTAPEDREQVNGSRGSDGGFIVGPPIGGSGYSLQDGRGNVLVKPNRGDPNGSQNPFRPQPPSARPTRGARTGANRPARRGNPFQ